MDRRTFFRCIPALPLVAAGVVTFPTHGITRVSMEKGDPGEIPWGKLRADGKIVRVFLDGVPQKYCRTADAKEGWVNRLVLTDKGNIAKGIDRVLDETVYGHVEILIEDDPRRALKRA